MHVFPTAPSPTTTHLTDCILQTPVRLGVATVSSGRKGLGPKKQQLAKATSLFRRRGGGHVPRRSRSVPPKPLAQPCQLIPMLSAR